MDCSLPGSSVHGILQARILELVAISFSRGSSRARNWTHVSYAGLLSHKYKISYNMENVTGILKQLQMEEIL